VQPLPARPLLASVAPPPLQTWVRCQGIRPRAPSVFADREHRTRSEHRAGEDRPEDTNKPWPGAHATLRLSLSNSSGCDQGRLLLYAPPSPVALSPLLSSRLFRLICANCPPPGARTARAAAPAATRAAHRVSLPMDCATLHARQFMHRTPATGHAAHPPARPPGVGDPIPSASLGCPLLCTKCVRARGPFAFQTGRPSRPPASAHWGHVRERSASSRQLWCPVLGTASSASASRISSGGRSTQPQAAQNWCDRPGMTTGASQAVHRP
jgi:hypothetical protein